MFYFDWLQKGAPYNDVERYPLINENNESTLAGVYIAGDLTGMPLLKYAADDGSKIVERLLKDRAFQSDEDIDDLLIIGAGPAGVSAAISAKKNNLRFTMVEANRPFSTIANFPAKKPIFLEPYSYKQQGPLKMQAEVKEELLEELEKYLADGSIKAEKDNITELKADGKNLLAKGEKGKYRAKKIILAAGKSGNYRKLDVPGEDKNHVSNRLFDASEFKGKKVLVVGGGDSALEASIALALNGADTSISYRQKSFSRPKEGNIKSLEKLEKEKKVQVLMGSQVKAIHEKKVDLIDSNKQNISSEFDQVFVLIGKELPVAFLKRSGIKLEGEKDRSWILGMTSLFSFFVMLYFMKAMLKSTALLQEGNNLLEKLWLYLSAPFQNIGWNLNVWDSTAFSLGWLGGVVFIFSGSILLVYSLRHWKKYYNTPWKIIKHSYFLLVAIGFFVFHLYHHYMQETIDWNRGTVYFYTLLYTTTMILFGIRRMMNKPTPYIIKQTLTLIIIQTFVLYLLPFHFYEWWIAPHADHWVVKELFPEGGWSSFGIILFWPLNFWTFGTSTFWTIFPFIQTFVILPYIVWRWGKGAYCGWICSCGGMAETLGDDYRTKAPHGKFAKKTENIGQLVLWLAFALLLYQLITIGVGEKALVSQLKGTHFANAYKFLIDVFFAGALGLGVYFFYSGRIWCRYGCPLAALMHIYAKFSRYRIFSDKKKCISCNVCTKVCHMGIDVMSYANKGKPMDDVECVRCSACVVSCPTGVLDFGHLKKGSNTPGFLEKGTRFSA